MRLSIRQYAQALLDLERETPSAETGLMSERFVAWLARRGESKKLAKIVREAERLLCEQRGIAEVTITTARATDASLEALLRTEAQRLFVGQTVEANFATDASLIGGVKMQSQEMLYDATLTTRSRQLGKSLRG